MGQGVGPSVLSGFPFPIEQPRSLGKSGNPVCSFQHLVLGQTVAAPVLVVEVHGVEHSVPSVEHVDRSGLRVPRNQYEEECTRRKLNPTDDLCLGTLRQPSACLVEADGPFKSEIFECEYGGGGECRRLLRLHVEPPDVQNGLGPERCQLAILVRSCVGSLRTGVASWPIRSRLGWGPTTYIYRLLART